MNCPYCQGLLYNGAKICPHCGRTFGIKKKRFQPNAAGICAAIVAAVLAILLLAVYLGRNKPAMEPIFASEPPTAAARGEKLPQENSPAGNLLRTEQISKFWTSYTHVGPSVEDDYYFDLNLCDDGVFSACKALIYADAAFDAAGGRWTFRATGPETGEVSLECNGGRSAYLWIRVKNDSLYIERSEGMDFLPVEQEFRPDWDYSQWKSEMGGAAAEQTRQPMDNDQAWWIYKDWFYSWFREDDQIWLVDVTRDGLNDMIVVSKDDELGNVIRGYVYTVDADSGEIKQIFYKEGSNFHTGGGFFRWFLEYQSGYCWLGEEYGYTAMGGGRLDYREYYLDNDGGIHECYHDYISNEDYPDGRIPDEEYAAYESRVTERLHLFSLLYSAYGEEDEIAMGEPTLPSSPIYWFVYNT